MSHAWVIGAGPAGLMAAEVLARAGHQVTIADQMPSFGRKFLMAGKSGLNLTKAEDPAIFLRAFRIAPPAFQDAVTAFGPDEVHSWVRDLGQEVFIGSTGRVFPKVMKASPLLRAWLARLDQAGVTFQRRWRWMGWQGTALCFDTPDGPQTVKPDATVLALGGASWARLGSDGAWAAHLADTAPFQPANCGFAVDWSPYMAPFFGTPIKATALRSGDLLSRGVWVITDKGIEGGGIYEISSAIRETGRLTIDLMPDVELAAVGARISSKRKKMSRKQILRQALRLSPVKQALFNEVTKSITMAVPNDIAQMVKALPLQTTAPLPMDGAISTAGGLRFDGLDDRLMLRAHPGTFAAGEMLDWDAPTGGYLITGCLATGRLAGQGAARWMAGESACESPAEG